jgi:DNA-binding XRE family transcriptional regulator
VKKRQRIDWTDVIARRVQELRRRRRVTQIDLGHSAGVDARTVRAIERGQANPTLFTLVQIAKVLGVEPAALFDEE